MLLYFHPHTWIDYCLKEQYSTNLFPKCHMLKHYRTCVKLETNNSKKKYLKNHHFIFQTSIVKQFRSLWNLEDSVSWVEMHFCGFHWSHNNIPLKHCDLRSFNFKSWHFDHLTNVLLSLLYPFCTFKNCKRRDSRVFSSCCYVIGPGHWQE